MSTVAHSLSDTVLKAEAIYKEKIRPTLVAADKGKYLTINAKTGEWFMGEDDVLVGRQGIERWGYGQPIISMRIGYRAVVSFRPGVDLELAEW